MATVAKTKVCKPPRMTLGALAKKAPNLPMMPRAISQKPQKVPATRAATSVNEITWEKEDAVFWTGCLRVDKVTVSGDDRSGVWF